MRYKTRIVLQKKFDRISFTNWLEALWFNTGCDRIHLEPDKERPDLHLVQCIWTFDDKVETVSVCFVKIY